MSNKKQTIAEFLNVKEFPFEIKDSNGNVIYYESSNGYWIKAEFDTNNNVIYYENSDGFWIKREFDSNNNQIYYENSEGTILDNRTKELTMQEIADKFGIKVEELKIKK